MLSKIDIDVLALISRYLFNNTLLRLRSINRYLRDILLQDSFWRTRSCSALRNWLNCSLTTQLNSKFSTVSQWTDSISLSRQMALSTIAMPDVVNNPCVEVISKCSDGICCFTFISDSSERFAVGTFGTHEVQIYSCHQPPSNGFVTRYRSHNGSVWKLTRINGCIASASFDCTVAITDIGDGDPRLITRLLGHQDRVLSLCRHDVTNGLISGSRDRTCRLWDTRMGESVMSVHVGSPCVYSVASWHNSLLAGCHCGTIKLFDLRHVSSARVVAAHKVGNSPVFSMHLVDHDAIADGVLVSSGMKDGNVHLSSLIGSSRFQKLASSSDSRDFSAVAAAGSVRTVQVCNGGRHIICSDNGGYVRLYSTGLSGSKYDRNSVTIDQRLSGGGDGDAEVIQRCVLRGRRRVSLQQLTNVECSDTTGVWSSGMDGIVRSVCFLMGLNRGTRLEVADATSSQWGNSEVIPISSSRSTPTTMWGQRSKVVTTAKEVDNRRLQLEDMDDKVEMQINLIENSIRNIGGLNGVQDDGIFPNSAATNKQHLDWYTHAPKIEFSPLGRHLFFLAHESVGWTQLLLSCLKPRISSKYKAQTQLRLAHRRLHNRPIVFHAILQELFSLSGMCV
eukprot:gene683-1306_t